jgi:protein-tyrosine kinase
MTIIERALQKHRAGGDSAPRTSSSKQPRRDAPLPVDPKLRLPRTSMALDAEKCRERRVMLSADTDNDRGYVAAYRMLRTRLLHRARGAQWSIIGVTSASPNDGKTLTAINLALSLARDKTRDVVLLDLDMRNPSVCKAFGIRPQQELRDYLADGRSLEGVFASVGSDNLLVAGSMSPTENASELLADNRFDDLLATIRRGTMDPLVLIDLPPVLVTDDALVVAPKIDSMLLVASEGLTKRAELNKALDLLSEFPMAGVVLNRASESSASYRYGYEADSDMGAPGKKV